MVINDLPPSSEEIEIKVKRPDDLLEEYRVFVQDRESSGIRHLPARSAILIQDEVCMTCNNSIQFRIIYSIKSGLRKESIQLPTKVFLKYSY
jgi:hypothetical protein